MIAKFLLHVVLLVLPVVLCSQDSKYRSSERDQYYKKIRYTKFKPLENAEILRYENSNFDLEEISRFQNYTDSLDFTPYQDSVHISFLNTDNIEQITNNEKVANIDKYDILKYESKDNIAAFLYQSYKFESFNLGEPGIWIAISVDYGKNWEYLYTGIVQKQPLFLKWYSHIPFILSETELQIEGCLLRQLTPFSMPVSSHSYELVKDGIKVTFSLNKLRRDSDSDGLTDIYETKIFTDLENPDTDYDGIIDKFDLNPRKSNMRTERTIIFEQALEEEWNTSNIISFDTIYSIEKFYSDSIETVFIITDDKEISSIQPQSKRVIILSIEEYEKAKGIYNDGLNKMDLTPFFKVDKTKDSYIFSRSGSLWGEEYLITKTKKGWKLKLISSWIY